MDNNFVFQYDRGEEEETISLSDFPLTPEEHEDDEYKKELSTFQDLRSPSDQTDLFEFFSDLNSNNMSHAEDIIYCGKLIPFKEQYQYSTPFIYQNTQKHPTPTQHKLVQNFHRRRSESLSELKSTSRSNNTQIEMRNSRSLDYQKLSSMSSDSPKIHRNTSSIRGSARFNANVKIPKPKWYFMLFGNVRFQPEMDLQDIKNRQVRRTPSAVFSKSAGVVRKVPVNRKSSWGVLKVLSCRDDASVHVTRSLARMPRV